MKNFDINNEASIYIKKKDLIEGKKIKKESDQFYADRLCKVGDGIKKLSEKSVENLLKEHKKAGDSGRISSLIIIPDYSIILQNLLKLFSKKSQENPSSELELNKSISEDFIIEFCRILKNYDEIKELHTDINIDKLLIENNYNYIINYIVMKFTSDDYLGITAKFDQRSNSRILEVFLQECISETIEHTSDLSRNINLHFIVASSTLSAFLLNFHGIRENYKRKGINLNMTYSEKTNIEFEEAEHERGLAILSCIDLLDTDILALKNINSSSICANNIKSDQDYKILTGYLVKIQKIIFQYIEILSDSFISDEILKDIRVFIKSALVKELPSNFEDFSIFEQQEYLLDILNRPLRICKVTNDVNIEDFIPVWGKYANNINTFQICEKEDVKSLWEHDPSINYYMVSEIVCGIKDYQGEKYDLKEFSEGNSSRSNLYLSELSDFARYGMSKWNTIFIEIPQMNTVN